jgi:thioredoxin-related protein
MSLINTSLFLFLATLLLFMTEATAILDDETDDESEDEVVMKAERLPWAQDLLAESRQAACYGQPLVVMFGSSTCPYCSVVRSLYIAPLMTDERYPGIVSRELEIDSNQLVTDFSGKRVPMSALAAKHGVTLVPQVVVFGPDGKQAGKPVIGISNEDFYGFYLDQAINAGIDMVQSARKTTSSGAPSASPGVYVCD